MGSPGSTPPSIGLQAQVTTSLHLGGTEEPHLDLQAYVASFRYWAISVVLKHVYFISIRFFNFALQMNYENLSQKLEIHNILIG